MRCGQGSVGQREKHITNLPHFPLLRIRMPFRVFGSFMSHHARPAFFYCIYWLLKAY